MSVSRYRPEEQVESERWKPKLTSSSSFLSNITKSNQQFTPFEEYV